MVIHETFDADFFRMVTSGLSRSILMIVLLFDFVIAKENVKTCRESIVIPATKGIRINSLYVFESIAVRTLYQCSELCQRRKICRSANFMADEQRCHLNAVILSNVTAVHDTSAQYIGNDAKDSVSIDMFKSSL